MVPRIDFPQKKGAPETPRRERVPWTWGDGLAFFPSKHQEIVVVSICSLLVSKWRKNVRN